MHAGQLILHGVYYMHSFDAQVLPQIGYHVSACGRRAGSTLMSLQQGAVFVIMLLMGCLNCHWQVKATSALSCCHDA